MAATPGTFFAREVSISCTMAFACGERSSLTTSASRGVMSSVYTGLPRSNCIESFLRTGLLMAR